MPLLGLVFLGRLVLRRFAFGLGLGLCLGGLRRFGLSLLGGGGFGLALGFLAALGSGLGDALGGPLVGLDLVGGGLLPPGDRFQPDRAAFRLYRLYRPWRLARDPRE